MIPRLSWFSYGVRIGSQPGPPIPITCPAGNYAPTDASAVNGACIHVSYPALYNNLFWQNRAFQIGVGPLGTGGQNQQNVVSLFNANFTGGLGSAAASQASTGACPTGTSIYWDMGVRNDKGPGDHSSGFTLNPLNGILTPGSTGYNSTNLTGDPALVSQYCNGSRVPPEAGRLGFQVPAGIADSVIPNPVFSLQPTATVDEGNNWVNISWGPLSMLNAVSSTGINNVFLGDYTIRNTSPAINAITCGTGCTAEAINVSGVTTITPPPTDFFGNPRPDPSNRTHVDIGAFELQSSGVSTLSLSPSTLAFSDQLVGTHPTMTATLTNSGNTAAIAYSSLGGSGFARTPGAGFCGATLAGASSCVLSITFSPTQSTQAYSAALTLTFGAGSTPATLTLGLSGVGFQLLTPTAISFAPQEKGTTSAPQTVALNNLSASPLTITAIALGGANSGQFAAPNFSNCGASLPITLAAHASCSVTEAYSPTTTGPNSATAALNFTVTGGTGPYSVALSGTAAAPAFTVSPAALAFGNQPDLTTSATQPVTLNNTGIGALTVTAIGFTGTNPGVFTQTNGCGREVVPGSRWRIGADPDAARAPIRSDDRAVLGDQAGSSARAQ